MPKREELPAVPAATEEELEYFRKAAKVDPTIFFPETWTEEEKKRGIEALAGGSKLKQGSLHAIPRKCIPDSCPSGFRYCPVLKAGLSPAGYRCPVESALIEQLFWGYVDELGIDPESIVELGLVRDLVDQDIQQIRKSELLANEGFIQENIVGMSQEGVPIFRKDLAPTVDYEDRILRRKKEIRTALLATRADRAKYDLAGNTEQFSAKQMTELLQSFRAASFMEETRKEQELAKMLRAKEFLSMTSEDIIDGEIEETASFDDDEESDEDGESKDPFVC
jgi:hypothetical protein